MALILDSKSTIPDFLIFFRLVAAREPGEAAAAVAGALGPDRAAAGQESGVEA